MKKLLLCILVSASLIACTNQETKTDEKKEVASDTKGTVTLTGPDVDLIKKSFTYFADGDWTNLASCYADSAKSFHNVWSSSTDTTVGVAIPKIIEVFKKQRELIDGNINLGGTICEVVIMPDGSKYGHLWAEMSWKSKKGVAGKMVLFNSYGINKDGKITYDWPIYDTKDVVKLK
jgi:hypothetical protein